MKLIETQGCIQKPCPTWDAEVGSIPTPSNVCQVSQWTQWSVCSFTCGPGPVERLLFRSLGVKTRL